MKFYVISFLCHLLLLFAIYVKPVKDVKLDSKNVLVYLSELKVENNTPAPAPLQSFAQPEPKKEEKPKEEKKIEKKIEKKAVKKVVKKEVKKKEEPVKEEAKEEVKEEISSGNSAPYNPLAGLVKDGTGTYIGDQKSGGGIRYRIKREIEPEYPVLAKRANYRNEVVIKTKFLIGLNGKVEEIIFLDNFTSYGFRKEVEKALKKWEFDPIIYHGEKIKLYFYKDFRFNVK
ncbi:MULTISPECIES: energy transducer TonB [Fusobacterium]|uniref:energy transducer TonB n=1 Tax=Fusobacterium TaxID=848 RepID=UPI001031A097|nr:energy transducer TonB [Fusobacterium ulcerans]